MNQNFDSGNCIVVFKDIQLLEVTQVSFFLDYQRQKKELLDGLTLFCFSLGVLSSGPKLY